MIILRFNNDKIMSFLLCLFSSLSKILIKYIPDNVNTHILLYIERFINIFRGKDEKNHYL